MEPDVLTSRIPHIKQALLSAIEAQRIDLVYQGQNALPSQQLVKSRKQVMSALLILWLELTVILGD